MPTIRRPNTTLVLKQLAELKPQILKAGERGLRRGLLGTVAMSQRSYLSGPRPLRLDVRTARLRNSISAETKIVPGKGVVGTIGSNVKYAALHEFGFRGGTGVRGHTRVTKQLNSKGEAIDSRRHFRERSFTPGEPGKFIGFRDSRKQAQRGVAANQVQFVKAHTRKLNYAGRPFLSTALKRMQPIILDEIAKELAKIPPSK